METTASLLDFIQDDYIPKEKVIPERIKKEILLECEDTCCAYCGAPLYKYYTTQPRLLVTLRFDIMLSVKHKHCTNSECLMCQNKLNLN